MFSRLIKVISIIALSMAILAGCFNAPGKESAVGGSESTAGGKKLTIVTSFYPMYLHTINVARDIPGVEVVNLTKPQTGCLHDYSLTPDDMKMLEKAGVFVINGAGMEAFMDKVVKQVPGLKVVEASKGIEVIEEENPHLWVSITNSIRQVQNIGEQLSAADPENAERYKSNAESYVKKLEQQSEKMHKALDGIKNRNIVTFHEAFPYFAKEFNLNIKAVIEREPGTEPSARELADTIKTINESGIKALFAEPQYSAQAAGTIAGETGAKVYTLDPIVTGEAKGDYDAYLKAMDNNLEVLKEALD